MSEKQRTITNPMLVGAMELLRADNTPEHRRLVMQEILHARFLTPVIMDPPLVPDENGVARMDPNSQMKLLLLTGTDDKHYFMAYTDLSELKKWDLKPEHQVFAFKFSDYVKMLMDPNGDNQGVIINPFGHNLMITKQMIDDMLRKGQNPNA